MEEKRPEITYSFREIDPEKGVPITDPARLEKRRMIQQRLEERARAREIMARVHAIREEQETQE